MSIALFAKAIHCSRTNVYHIFNAKSIDIDKLILISNVLNYNFLDEYFLDDFSALQTQITLDIELKDVKVNIKQVEHV
jgi:transcriptional regulator with XRE-family HTH domain